MVSTVTLAVSMALVVCLCGAQKNAKCPPQEKILPCRCLIKESEYQIWCSHSDLPRVMGGLRSIGKYIFEPIDELILENNYLPSLPGRTFLPLRVVRLMLRYNGLQRVSNGWLTGLEESLMELYVVEPELRTLPDDSLNRLSLLEAVTIQTNVMKRLPSFSNLPKLTYVQIASLSLMELSPRHFKNLPALERINIDGSPMLMRLEADLFQDLPRLALLNVSYSGISWMHPRAITRLPALRHLSLVGNKITDAGMIGRGVRDLPNLESVQLDFNVIDRLNEAAFVDLPSLRTLSISNNRITEIQHGAFHRVPMLRTLNLNNNLVRRVHPESFLQHSGSGLQELWLVNNEISHVVELRSLLDALPRLTFLDMNSNNLEVIPYGALRGHPTLERLSLDHNKLKFVEREALTAMPALRELSLKNNSLSDILDAPIWDLPELKGLDLSGNFYRKIDRGLLTNLPSLRRVDFGGNRIDYINPASFMDTPALEYINLSFNNLIDVHPATFRHLSGLYELDIGDNRLLQFVPGLPRGLEYLHLKRNRVTSFPLDFNLPTLRMLDVSSNDVKRLSRDTFRSSPKLKRLYLGHNYLQNLDDGALDGLNHLELLDLQGNAMVSLSPKLLSQIVELKQLNLRNNRLTVLKPFIQNHHLEFLDVSDNQIKEMAPSTFENTRQVQILNASRNYLTRLPRSIEGLKDLRVLDATNNRLNNIGTVTSLASLSELRLSKNVLKELQSSTFANLQRLELLFLDDNDLETIATDTFRALPSLKHIKLNENKIADIPDYVFNDLPNLQVLELQDNLIQRISDKAFHLTTHMLVLNLSTNLISDVNEAGLQSLKSLEMLDLSFNRMTKVESSNLDRMEWLVELKMDSNRICGVHGAVFNRMPRLRVLSLKNNKMMSFPEAAVQKLRGNLAVLDIDGNPLACTCSLLWLKAWLQESSTTGPKCLDGSLLRENRLSRQECLQESRLLEPVAPGCESELLSIPDSYDASQVFTPWLQLTDNQTRQTLDKNNLSPEESDYFYDEYVDYPYNETLLNSLNEDMKGHNTFWSTQKPAVEKPGKSAHGDTPTIYAATKRKNQTKDTPKEISGSPSSSGFTFFGVPLPSLSKFFGAGPRMDDSKQINPQSSERKTIITEPIIVNEAPAERKMAIVNKPMRASVSRGMFPPSDPDVQTGFVPLLPGSGGFKPIVNPLIRRPITDVEIEKVDVKLIQVSDASNASPTSVPRHTQSHLLNENNMGHPIPTPTTKIPSTTPHGKETQILIQPPSKTDETELQIKPTEVRFTKLEVAVTNKSSNLKPEEAKQIKNISEFLSTTTPTVVTNSSNTAKPEIETATSSESFEDIFKEIVENISLPQIATTTKSTNEKIATIATPASTEPTNAKLRNVTLPALLIPGGLQPHYRPAGRSTITKIPSPHLTSSAAPLQSNLKMDEITPLPHNQEETTVRSVGNDKSWYFATYNQTNLEPYVDHSSHVANCKNVYAIFVVIFIQMMNLLF